jgi:hypothetical protein
MIDGVVFIPGSLGENSSSASLLQIIYHFDVPQYDEMIDNFRASHMKFFTLTTGINT